MPFWEPMPCAGSQNRFWFIDSGFMVLQLQYGITFPRTFTSPADTIQSSGYADGDDLHDDIAVCRKNSYLFVWAIFADRPPLKM